MKNEHRVIIFGAGGIGEAVGSILIEKSEVKPDIFIGDINYETAQRTAANIRKWTSGDANVTAFEACTLEAPNPETIEVLHKGEIIIDCLPGNCAVPLTRLALAYNLHYVNLTEYENETHQIMELAKNAEKGFLLQTGLAPGFINIVTISLIDRLVAQYGVDNIDKVTMRVGALPQQHSAPSHYGISWSSIGVANEYLSEATVIRDYKITKLPPLSERATRIIDGKEFEEDLTSGGAADLPSQYEGKVKELDYKTLRQPGHYDWVKKEIEQMDGDDALMSLTKILDEKVPSASEDFVIIYASVACRDKNGQTQSIEEVYEILPQLVGSHVFSAIQIATAAPLAESVRYLLESDQRGIISQSDIPTSEFLNSHFVKAFYQKASELV